MITLGIVDLILILLFVLAVYLSSQRRGLALTLLISFILAVVIIERLAPGTFARVGDAIHGIDRLNDAGPHITIQPIVRIEK